MKPQDSELLHSFLQHSISFPDDREWTEESKKEALNRYLENWGQMGDIGFIIELKESKKPIGAAWFRQFTAKNPGFAFIDEKIPELSIVVLPEYRGVGLGRDLLRKLIDQASLEGYPALSVNVNKKDPALDLYQKLDFQLVKETNNTQVLKRVL
jgi:GNAT superfamily N-acetyltransferase